MMNKTLLIILFGIGLTASTGAYAGIEQAHDLISKSHVQSTLETTRQMIFTKMVSNVCALSPFTPVCGVEAFGVDEIGPDSILREQLKNNIFTGQTN
jgi:hypothetical protein